MVKMLDLHRTSQLLTDSIAFSISDRNDVAHKVLRLQIMVTMVFIVPTPHHCENSAWHCVFSGFADSMIADNAV